MIITQQIEEAVLGFNGIWVVIHFTYFSIYYSRYSACFHKLRSIAKLEKAGVYDQKLIDTTRVNTWKRIKKLQRISFFPTLGIFLLHQITFCLYWEWEIFAECWRAPIYILIGALVFIFLANKTQGSRVLPTKGPSWPRGPF